MGPISASNLAVTFQAPSDGSVLFGFTIDMVWFAANSSGVASSAGIWNNSTSAVVATGVGSGVSLKQIAWTVPDANWVENVVYTQYVTGLTPGNTYTWSPSFGGTTNMGAIIGGSNGSAVVWVQPA
jgi:hypothetical protein